MALFYCFDSTYHGNVGGMLEIMEWILVVGASNHHDQILDLIFDYSAQFNTFRVSDALFGTLKTRERHHHGHFIQGQFEGFVEFQLVLMLLLLQLGIIGQDVWLLDWRRATICLKVLQRTSLFQLTNRSNWASNSSFSSEKNMPVRFV